MTTKLFLFATLRITTITFSQASKKEYNYYKAMSDVSKSQKTNKGELVDATSKDNRIGFGTTSISKRAIKRTQTITDMRKKKSES
jgi:hypothetical protein|tara:strand:+ start:2064 stop:2318 length:255 start_codon:yes stop_codon:yes gene_type:complete